MTSRNHYSSIQTEIIIQYYWIQQAGTDSARVQTSLVEYTLQLCKVESV